MTPAALKPAPPRHAGALPLVGRDEEMRLMERLVSDGGSALLVHGDQGIGKTRLVTEFLARAREDGVQVAQGGCYPVAEAGPYFPILQALRHLGEGDARLLRGAAGLRGMLPPDAQTRRARFVRQLADAILGRASNGRTMLCIEDLHWGDIGSLLVLNDLLDAACPSLTLVCTARPEERISAGARQLLNRIRQRSRLLELDGLAAQDLRGLLAGLPEATRLTPEELAELHRFTDGNPLFVRELARCLRDTDLLQRFRMGEAIKRLRIPSDLAAAVDLRLARLPHSALEVLSAVSVLGGEQPLAALQEMLNGSPRDVQGLVELAAEENLVTLGGSIADPRVRLSHALYERRLYERLPPKVRRALHRGAVRAAQKGALALIGEDLARHCALGLGRAGGKRAVAACRRAAEHAERLLAFELAARYWEMALSCAGQGRLPERADLHARRGRALWAAGDWSEAAAAWTQAVDLYEQLGANAQAASVCAALGDMCRWRSDLDGAQAWLERAIALGLRARAERGRTLAILGAIYRFRRDGRADATLEEARQAAGTQRADPRTQYWLSYAEMIAGEKARANDLARSGLREAERRADASATALLANSLFHHELGALHLASASEYAAVAERAATQSDAATTISAVFCSALLHGYRGEWRRVLEACEGWMANVRLASRFQVATASLVWAEARFAIGDAAAAEATASEALADLGEMRPIAEVHLARMLAYEGRHAECAPLVAAHAPTLFDSARATVVAGRAALGEIAALVGDKALSERCYASLLHEAQPLVMAYAPISVQRVLGTLASALRRWPEAIGHFQTAAATLAEGGARWELAAALLDHAEMRRRRGRRGDAGKAAALELQAEAVYEELGIARPAHRCATTLPLWGNRFGLTTRELEVLDLVASGLRNQEIATRLFISTGTVNRHLENIYGKMGVKNRAEAVLLAAQEELIAAPEAQDTMRVPAHLKM